MKSPTVKVPLHLDGLSAAGCDVVRSGIRWLCPDGHRCRPGEVIAWCNIGLVPGPLFPGGPLPFAGEGREFQVALAPRVAGRLVKKRGLSRGGFYDMFEGQHVWSPGRVIGHLECAPGSVEGDPEGAGRLRNLLLAGRRTAEFVEFRFGPLTGWHDRSRGWWADGDGDFGTVLSLGTCEQLGIIRGERGAFFELFAQTPGPAQVVFTPDDTLVPSSPVLFSQLQHTQADRERIAEDMVRTMGDALARGGATPAAAADAWIFAGCLLKALTRSPLLDRYELLTRGGVRQVGPADAVILSLPTEGSSALRHKRLGYALQSHGFRASAGGPAVAKWLEAEFEKVPRTTEDVRRDYLKLIDALGARTNGRLLILNSVCSTAVNEIYSYAPFPKPLHDFIGTVRAAERNLMLYQVARERNVSVVDVDALAVELGVGKHVPDMIHQSGRLQRAVRERILAILGERGVPGFGERLRPSRAGAHARADGQGGGAK